MTWSQTLNENYHKLKIYITPFQHIRPLSKYYKSYKKNQTASR